jgi:hypothetical protein
VSRRLLFDPVTKKIYSQSVNMLGVYPLIEALVPGDIIHVGYGPTRQIAEAEIHNQGFVIDRSYDAEVTILRAAFDNVTLR